MLWQTTARIFPPLWPSMSSHLRCYCGCGGVGRIRLGSPRMTLLSLKCKLKACIVHHEKLHTFMRLYEEAGDDLNRKAILLNVRRMAREHKVGKIWGPVSLNSAGSLCPAPSPLRATPKGRLRFSSPVPTINSEALQRARDTIYGPEITRCFQQPSNGAYRNNVTSAQKLALRAQRRAFEEVAAQNAQQATYRRALEEALVDATAPKESAPAWLPHPRVPGAYFPGLSWERIKSFILAHPGSDEVGYLHVCLAGRHGVGELQLSCKRYQGNLQLWGVLVHLFDRFFLVLLIGTQGCAT